MTSHEFALSDLAERGSRTLGQGDGERERVELWWPVAMELAVTARRVRADSPYLTVRDRCQG